MTSYKSIQKPSTDTDEIDEFIRELDIDNFDDIDQLLEGADFCEETKEKVRTPLKKSSRSIECSDCKSSEIIRDNSSGILVCKFCGQVQETMFDHGPEWRQFDEDGKNESGRCSKVTNELLPLSSLGLKYNGNVSKSARLIMKWTNMPYRERSLFKVYNDITEKCEKAGIPKNIQNESQILYKIASESIHNDGVQRGKAKITRGKNRKGIIAACVFYSCRKNKKARTPKEIASMFGIKNTDMSKGVKNLFELLEQRKMSLSMGSSRADQYVLRYCNEHTPKIKTECSLHAMKIARNVEKLNIASEHTPFSIAATSVLLMAEFYGVTTMNKKSLSERFNVSEVTISKTYKKIEKFKKLLSDDDLVEDYLISVKNSEKISVMTDVVQERMKKFNIKFDFNTTKIMNTQTDKTFNQLLCDIKNCGIYSESFLPLIKEINERVVKFESDDDLSKLFEKK